MPFDQPVTPASRPERRRRVRISAQRLKFVIVQLALEGALTPTEAEDLISYYGLRNA